MRSLLDRGKDSYLAAATVCVKPERTLVHVLMHQMHSHQPHVAPAVTKNVEERLAEVQVISNTEVL